MRHLTDRLAVRRAETSQVADREDQVLRRVRQERAACAALHPRTGTVIAVPINPRIERTA